MFKTRTIFVLLTTLMLMSAALVADEGRYVILSKRPTGQGSRSGDDDLRELQGSLVCPRSGENQGEEAV